jgi:hypothetical protein
VHDVVCIVDLPFGVAYVNERSVAKLSPAVATSEALESSTATTTTTAASSSKDDEGAAVVVGDGMLKRSKNSFVSLKSFFGGGSAAAATAAAATGNAVAGVEPWPVGAQVGTCVGLARVEGFDTQRDVYVLSTQFGALVYVPRQPQVATANTAESDGGSTAVSNQHQPAHKADNQAQGQSVGLLTSLIHRSSSLLSLPSALRLGKAEETSKAAAATAAGDKTATTPDAASGAAGGVAGVKGDEQVEEEQTLPPGHTAFSWTDKRSEDLPQHAGLPGF